MNTLYSHAIRVLVCQSCGAPFDATIAGGQIRCSYCQATNVVTQRNERLDKQRAQEALAAPISESERFAQLRMQDQGAEAMPESLRPWLSGGALAAGAVPQAQADWQQARQQIMAGSQSFGLAERFFYVTILLADHVDDRQQRALLETAAELLSDARHRHVVRCMLARLAAQHGDLAGAQAWLDTCNPRPTDLIMDTAFRLAAATLATAKGDTNRVFDLVGHRAGDVPLADRQQWTCDALRVHALEVSGQLPAAAQEMRAWIRERGADRVGRELARFRPLHIAARAYGQATQAETTQADEAKLESLVETRKKLPTGAAAFSRPTMLMPLLAIALLVPVSVVRCSFDADPLMGAYGVPICPKVCHGCHGPTRTVTVWHQVGPGEWSSDGAEYFCSGPDGEIADWSSGQLEANTRRLARQEMGTLAAFGGTYITLYLLVMLFAPFIGVVLHIRNQARAGPLDQQIDALCARLRRERPPSRPAVDWPKALVIIPTFHLMFVGGALTLILLSVLT